MKIPLNEFEHHIEEKTLEKGFNLFEKKQIQFIESPDTGLYVFSIKNNEISVTLKNQVVTGSFCQVHGNGKSCEHVAACIFYLSQNALDTLVPEPIAGPSEKAASSSIRKKKATTTTTRKARKPKKQTPNSILKKLLSQASQEDLLHIIDENLKRNLPFKQQVVSSLSHLNDDYSKEYYTALIELMTKSSHQRYADDQVFEKMAILSEYITEANEEMLAGQEERAVNMLLAVLENAWVLLAKSYNKRALLRDIFTPLIKMLTEGSILKVAGDLKEKIFDFLMELPKHKKGVTDTSWALQLYGVATFYADTKDKQQKLMDILEAIPTNEYIPGVLTMRFNLIVKLKGFKEAESYAMQNLQNDELREAVIELYRSQGEFKKALDLINDKIAKSKRTDIQSMYIWYDWLVDIYVELKQTKKAVEVAKKYFLTTMLAGLYNSNTFSVNLSWYRLLNEQLKKEELLKFTMDIADLISKRVKEGGPTALAIITLSAQNTDMTKASINKYKKLEMIEAILNLVNDLEAEETDPADPAFVEYLVQVFTELIIAEAKSARGWQQFEIIAEALNTLEDYSEELANKVVKEIITKNPNKTRLRQIIETRKYLNMR